MLPFTLLLGLCGQEHYSRVKDMTLGACGFEETIFLKNVAFATFISSEIVFG